MPLHSGTTEPVAPSAGAEPAPVAAAPTGAALHGRTEVRWASRDWLVVHHPHRPDGTPPTRLIAAGDVSGDPAGAAFDGVDADGRFAWVRLRPGARRVRFRLAGPDRPEDPGWHTVDPAVHDEVWLDGADPTRWHPAPPGEPAPPAPAAPTTAVLHYRPVEAEQTDGWGLHVWDGAAHPTVWDAPLAPVGRDSYGLVFQVPLAPGAGTLAVLPHRRGAADPAGDRHLDLTRGAARCWLLGGVPAPLLPAPMRGDPAVDLTRARAHWVDRSTVAWPDAGAVADDGRVHHLVGAPDGGLAVVGGDLSGSYRTVHLIARAGGLTDAQRQRFPHLAGYAALGLVDDDPERCADLLRGQLVVTERDDAGRLVTATGVQVPGVLDDLYAPAATAPLGPSVDDRGRPGLAVWAPTARTVELELSDTPSAAAVGVAMQRDGCTGVWSVTGEPTWWGRYYRYRVTVWQPAVQQVVTARVTDPYAVALAADSTHSQLVDLAEPALAPAGWPSAPRPAPVPPAAMHIQELSVRDFSIGDASVPAAQRGTYLAFTRTDSAGMRHLRALATAGVTHLHLLPAYDFGTVPERRAEQAVPAGDLAALPPDSPEQQARIAEVAHADGYNWGYDPVHYTVPDGSYAVEPDGTARTREFRAMVAALHGIGLRVVLDVVYNHTYASGAHHLSVLDRIVPGYYHRLLDDGRVADSTCCSNTAPEHAMMGRLVVDSVLTWARAYRVDGFRFDLMGHHPKANLLAVRAALDELTVERDGVDGRSIYLYGEGWDFGEVWGGSRFVQATQPNLRGTGIGTFNDRLRDAVRGGAPFERSPRAQGFATGLFTDPNGDPVNGPPEQQRNTLLHLQDQIKVGLAGNLADYRFRSAFGYELTGAQVDNDGSPTGYAASPGEAVAFVDAHDNEILYDALAFKLPPGIAMLDRVRMQVLALALVVLAQGPGFVTAGSERLRSKSLDRNSYNSGDWFNQIRWNCAEGNGFGIGLPPAADNADRWPYARPLLADRSLVPDCAAIELATARYLELLRVAGSSPLFRLDTAEEVQRRVSFPLSGPAETPGVVTMRLDGVGLDPRWASVTVVFNACVAATTQVVEALRGADVALHPAMRQSADPLVASAYFDREIGGLAVPARTVVAFVQHGR